MKNCTENTSIIYHVSKDCFNKQLLKRNISPRVDIELKKFLKSVKVSSINRDALLEWFRNDEDKSTYKIIESDFTKIIGFLKCQPFELAIDFDYADTFRVNLKALIKINNLTNKKLAEIIGVTENTVNSWTKVKGKLPSRANIEKICDHFNKDYDYFTGRVSYYGHAVSEVCSKTGLNITVAEMLVEHKQIFDDYKEFRKSMIFPDGYTPDEINLIQNLIQKQKDILSKLPNIKDPEFIKEYEDSQKNLTKYDKPQTLSEYWEDECTAKMRLYKFNEINERIKAIDKKREFSYFYKQEAEKHECMQGDANYNIFLINFLNNLLQPEILNAIYHYVYPDVQAWAKFGNNIEIEISDSSRKEIINQAGLTYNDSLIKKYCQEAALRLIQEKLDNMNKTLENVKPSD